MSQFPGWARSQSAAPRDATLVRAGAALALLQSAAGGDADWRGAWRDRLALKVATGCLAVIGHTDSEAALRDAFLHREPGADPGPGGRMYDLWRRFTRQSPPAREEDFADAAVRCGFVWSEDLRRLWIWRMGIDALADPLSAAVQVACTAVAIRRESRPLVFLLADATLAAGARWPRGVPLLALAAMDPLSPLGGSGGDQDQREWQGKHYLAYSQALSKAWDLAAELGDRAAALRSVEGLRAKGSKVLIDALLSNDAVRAGGPDQWISADLTITQRARRRFLETLERRQIVRELTGRTTSRLYGL
jgi:hypothetical protein